MIIEWDWELGNGCLAGLPEMHIRYEMVIGLPRMEAYWLEILRGMHCILYRSSSFFCITHWGGSLYQLHCITCILHRIHFLYTDI